MSRPCPHKILFFRYRVLVVNTESTIQPAQRPNDCAIDPLSEPHHHTATGWDLYNPDWPRNRAAFGAHSSCTVRQPLTTYEAVLIKRHCRLPKNVNNYNMQSKLEDWLKSKREAPCMPVAHHNSLYISYHCTLHLTLSLHTAHFSYFSLH